MSRATPRGSARCATAHDDGKLANGECVGTQSGRRSRNTLVRCHRLRHRNPSFALPLRIVAAGTGENTALTLYVVGKGRYEVANFRNERVDQNELIFNMADNTSNYVELRLDTLKRSDGASWLTSYALQGSLMSPRTDPIQWGSDVEYALSNGTRVGTIADAYILQGAINGEGSDTSCISRLQALADSHLKVWHSPCGDDPLCIDRPGTPDNSIDASELSCGGLDDLAVALGGKVIRSAWITRLEASAPRWPLEPTAASCMALGRWTCCRVTALATRTLRVRTSTAERTPACRGRARRRPGRKCRSPGSRRR